MKANKIYKNIVNHEIKHLQTSERNRTDLMYKTIIAVIDMYIQHQSYPHLTSSKLAQ